MLRKLFSDETGAVVSAELILIITITFCAVATGWATIGSAIVYELNDISDMIGVVDQSFNVTSHSANADGTKPHGQCTPFGFNDRDDDCDCKGVVPLNTCGKTQTLSGTSGATESP